MFFYFSFPAFSWQPNGFLLWLRIIFLCFYAMSVAYSSVYLHVSVVFDNYIPSQFYTRISTLLCNNHLKENTGWIFNANFNFEIKILKCTLIHDLSMLSVFSPNVFCHYLGWVHMLPCSFTWLICLYW